VQPILTDIQYRADGQITAATFGNGLRETRTYDQQGRLTHQDLKDDVNTNLRCPVFSEVRCPLFGGLQSHLVQLEDNLDRH